MKDVHLFLGIFGILLIMVFPIADAQVIEVREFYDTTFGIRAHTVVANECTVFDEYLSEGTRIALVSSSLCFRGVWTFDLSNIPETATISSANVTMDYTDGVGGSVTSPRQCELYPMIIMNGTNNIPFSFEELATGHTDATLANQLWLDAGNGTAYNTNVDCGVADTTVQLPAPAITHMNTALTQNDVEYNRKVFLIGVKFESETDDGDDHIVQFPDQTFPTSNRSFIKLTVTYTMPSLPSTDYLGWQNFNVSQGWVSTQSASGASCSIITPSASPTGYFGAGISGSFGVEVEASNDAGGFCLRGLPIWDTYQIPNEALVDSIELNHTLKVNTLRFDDFTENARVCDVNKIDTNIFTASRQQAWDDAGDGTNFINDSTICTTDSATGTTLPQSMIDDLQEDLDANQDWWGFGMKYDDETRTGGGIDHRTFFLKTGFQLRVNYSNPIHEVNVNVTEATGASVLDANVIIVNASGNTSTQTIDNDANGWSNFTGQARLINITAIEKLDNIVVNFTFNKDVTADGNLTMRAEADNIFTVDCPNNGVGNDITLKINFTDGHHITGMSTPTCNTLNTMTWNVNYTAHGGQSANLTSEVVVRILDDDDYGSTPDSFKVNSVETTMNYIPPVATSDSFNVQDGQTSVTNLPFSLTLHNASGGGGGGGGGSPPPASTGTSGGASIIRITVSGGSFLFTESHRVILGQTVDDGMIDFQWSALKNLEVEMIMIEENPFQFVFEETPFDLTGSLTGISNGQVLYSFMVPEIECQNVQTDDCVFLKIYDIPILISFDLDGERFTQEIVISVNVLNDLNLLSLVLGAVVLIPIGVFVASSVKNRGKKSYSRKTNKIGSAKASLRR